MRFASTKRFTTAVELINGLEVKPLSKVLSRLLAALPDKGAGSFSDAETAQMRELFGLSAAQIDQLLGGCLFIFEQAAYNTVPPEQLNDELVVAGIAEGHARAFAATWQAGATDVVRRLKDNAVLAPAQLTAVDWQLCVGTAGSGGERGHSAHSILELELTTQQPPGALPAGSSERKVHLRMGREGMVDLLAKLDKVQAQIDKLS